MKRIFDLQEASRELGISIHTMRKWVRKGRIAHVRLGIKIFLREEDLEDLIKENLVPCKENARQQNNKKEKGSVREVVSCSEETMG